MEGARLRQFALGRDSEQEILVRVPVRENGSAETWKRYAT